MAMSLPEIKADAKKRKDALNGAKKDFKGEKIDIVNMSMDFADKLDKLSAAFDAYTAAKAEVDSAVAQIAQLTKDMDKRKKAVAEGSDKFNGLLAIAQTLGSSMIKSIDKNKLRDKDNDTKARDFSGLWNDATTLNALIKPI